MVDEAMLMRGAFPGLFCLALSCARVAVPPAGAVAPQGRAAPGELTFFDGDRVFGAVHGASDARQACEATFEVLTPERDLLVRSVESADDGGVLDSLLALDAKVHAAANMTYFLSRAHGSAEVRTAAGECSTRLNAFATEVPRGRVLARLETLSGRNAAEARYVANVIDEAKRSGALLAPGTAAQVTSLNAHIDALTNEMNETMGHDARTMRVAQSRLSGLPEPFLDAHPPDATGLVKLAVAPSDVTPVRRFAADRILAAELFRMYRNKAFPENEAPLHDLLETRKKEASLLGFDSWADLAAASRMVHSRSRTVAFLDEAERALGLVNARYRASLGLAEGAPWPAEADAPFLEGRAVRERYGVDAARVAEYFELGSTLRGMLAAIGEMHGLRFQEGNAPTWSTDVTVFDVTREDGSVVGRLEYDLLARDGKRTAGGTSVAFVPRTLGSKSPVQVGVLMNVPRPVGTTPSLLTVEQLSGGCPKFRVIV